MKVSDKYKIIFGSIDSLDVPISWTSGLSNMLEWLIWETQYVLGVTKTQFRKTVVEWSLEEVNRVTFVNEIQDKIAQRYDLAIRAGEVESRYAPPMATLANPRELLRRAKYFSENYLNKEFDIFWSLASDNYLDSWYSKFTTLKGGGEWFAHGNSGIFATSTGIGQMQMDNVSYNPHEGLLIANELKLGGKKNPDQLLKYALLFRLLIERKFILANTRFVLLFIGTIEQKNNWLEVLNAEIKYCMASTKGTSKDALHPVGLYLAKQCEYVSTTWGYLQDFNEAYSRSLSIPTQQVEQKLISGFNDTLKSKYLLRPK